jgi:hypothetical protein
MTVMLTPDGQRMRLVGHVDLFKRDPDTGQQALVSTTRPCVECGQPLEGMVVPVGQDQQAHARCRESRRVAHATSR